MTRDVTGRERDIAVVGTYDVARGRAIAQCAATWAGARYELALRPDGWDPGDRPPPWDPVIDRCQVLVDPRPAGEPPDRRQYLRAIEAGVAVVTDCPSDLGRLVPGEHVVVCEPSRLGAVALALAHDEETRMAIARRARRAVDEPDFFLPDRADPSGRTGVAPAGSTHHASELTARDVDRLADRSAAARWQVVPPDETQPGSADIGVVCVALPGDGPIGRTASSASTGRGEIDLYFADSALDDAPPAVVGPMQVRIRTDRAVGRAALRNRLIAESGAAYLCIVDSGDALLPRVIARLVERMQRESLDIAFAVAADLRRGLRNAYPIDSVADGSISRGYVVTRTWLESVGGFPEDPYLRRSVDAEMWQLAVARHARVGFEPVIGFDLWPSRASANGIR